MFFFPCAADMVLDHQEASNELDDSVRVKVREALLKRHHHQNEKKKNLIPMVRSIAEGTRKQSEPHLTGLVQPLFFLFFLFLFTLSALDVLVHKTKRVHYYLEPLVPQLSHTAPSASVVHQVLKTNYRFFCLAKGNPSLRLKEPDDLQELFVPEKSNWSERVT